MTPVQAALLKKARENLGAARLLSEEEYLDIAASRSYYAMFYAAQAMLLGEGLEFSKHSAVISAFGKRFAKTMRVPLEFHRYLIESEDSRLLGDYEIQSETTEDKVNLQISRAEQFIEMAERLLAEQNDKD